MKRFFGGVAAVATLGLIACENVDSTDVLTSGVYADITATADGEGQTQVSTSLRVGGARSNTYMELVGDDKLTATVDQDIKTMAKHSLLGAVWYEVSFDVDAADTVFDVAFERSVDDGAPKSSLTLPAPFDITGPAADTEFSRTADDIVLTWNPANSADSMRLTADGDCIQIYTTVLDGDAGSATISHSDVKPQRDRDAETCTVNVMIERRRAGDLDSNYGEGGEIWAVHKRELKIKSAP